MARMIPSILEDSHDSFGEIQVFEALRDKLDSEYTVFHSIRWNSRNERNTIIWGECDFTVFHPKKGMLIIEVKSGGIECIDNQWAYIRTDNGEKHTMKHPPLEQADREITYKFQKIISALLERKSRPSTPQYCMVEKAAWFPSISKRDIVGKLPMEYVDEIVLYENALDDPQRYIDAIYDYYGGIRHTRMSEESYDEVCKMFAPMYAAVPSLRSKREEKNTEFVRLTNEQMILIDYLEEQNVAAIQGAAGTGKTMLAIEKAIALSKSGKVLFLCYNTFLREYLESVKEARRREFENIDILSLKKLTCRKLGVEKVTDDDIYQFLCNYENYDWEYKHIVIDEGQDFSERDINALYEIGICQEGAFYIFFDKKQFVQGDVFARRDEQKRIELPEWLEKAECRLILSTNCRNTYQIAETSGKPVNVVPKTKRSVKGDVPQFFICKDNKDAIKKINVLIDQLIMNKYPYSEICILTVKAEAKSILHGVEKIGNHRVVSQRDGRGVLFTTARKFKGLESDAVIMIDVDEHTFDGTEITEDGDPRMLFYVGSSRAKHIMDIVFVGDDDRLDKVVKAIDSKKRYPNAKIGIAASLNVKPQQV